MGIIHQCRSKHLLHELRSISSIVLCRPNGAGSLANLIDKDVRFTYSSISDLSMDYDKNNDAQNPESLHRVLNNDGPNQKVR